MAEKMPEPCAPVFLAELSCLRLWPSVRRTDVQRLCEQLRGLLTGTATGALICDVSAVTAPDIGTVEVLARLQLTALRHGRSLQLHGQCRRLRELLVLVGLSDVLAACREPGADSKLPGCL